MTLDEAKMLAIASINMVSKGADGSEHIKISEIKSDDKQFVIIEQTQIAKLLESAKEKYSSDEKQSS